MYGVYTINNKNIPSTFLLQFWYRGKWTQTNGKSNPIVWLITSKCTLFELESILQGYVTSILVVWELTWKKLNIFKNQISLYIATTEMISMQPKTINNNNNGK